MYEDRPNGNMTSMDMNLILDSEGQVEDYFNADKNPFTQRQGDSVDEIGGFLDRSQKTLNKNNLNQRISTNPFTNGGRAASGDVGGEETSEDNEGMVFRK